MIKKDTIRRINEGDKKAFEKLYSTYYTYLCKVAAKYVLRADVAEEIVNDILLSVWNNKENLAYPVKPYLVRSVQNRCLNYILRRKTEEVSMADMQESLLTVQELQVHQCDHPLFSLENKEMADIIHRAVSALPPKCRIILKQHLYQNRTYEEISEINHITPSTVRVHIKLGLTRLKKSLKSYYGHAN
jgi:RNA polymerase sigma-70 factor (ECF subfamily)